MQRVVLGDIDYRTQQDRQVLKCYDLSEVKCTIVTSSKKQSSSPCFMWEAGLDVYGLLPR